MKREVEMARRGTGFPPGERGFSLVEVTLALLVVAVGMTAAFSLFPEAIKNTRAAQDNTETALFADYVFSTLELTAGRNAVDENVQANGLDKDANDFISPSFNRSKRNSRAPEVTLGEGSVRTFYWMPDYYGLGSGDMASSHFDELKTAVFTYQLTLKDKGGRGSPIQAVLKVLPGEYDSRGISWKDPNVRIFYREILPPK